MGDSSYIAPDLQFVHDGQKSNPSKENHVGQNGKSVGENHAANVETESLSELPSNEGESFCSAKAPLQQNGHHAEREECKTHPEKLGSEGAQIDISTVDKNGTAQYPEKLGSGGAQIDMSTLDKNGTLSSHEARQEDLNGDKTRDYSLLPMLLQEGIQEVAEEETGAGARVNILREDPAVNQVYPCSSDSSNVVGVGDTMDDENVISSNDLNDNINKGDEDDAPSKVLGDSSEKAEESHLKEKHGAENETERPDESVTESSTPPCISTESNLENNVQPPLFHSVSESVLHENEVSMKPVGDLDVTPLTKDVHAVSQNEVNLSKGEWPDQRSGVVISTDLEGWQRFDAEEVNATMDHPQGSGQKLELWETLLDDGLDVTEREIQNPPLQLVLAPKFELASPGNPFTEGMQRISSFSEADGFAENRELPSSGRLSHSFEEPSSFQWREEQFCNVSGSDDTSSVIATPDVEANAVQLESINEDGGNLDAQLPSSRKALPSFDATEPFEAPSFMSLVDPKSHALFGACMPTFQASNVGYVQENGGEKWVANFDLMAPSPQEITRSSSMPRSGGEASGQRPGQSFSFGTRGEQKPSELAQVDRTKSGFLSPKLSPLVQKVVEKVRTAPAVANGVLNSVRQGMSSTTRDTKPPPKSLFTRCTCW